MALTVTQGLNVGQISQNHVAAGAFITKLQAAIAVNAQVTAIQLTCLGLPPGQPNIGMDVVLSAADSAVLCNQLVTLLGQLQAEYNATLAAS
jgi:hypothetical protein